jgi:hypothetical protein
MSVHKIQVDDKEDIKISIINNVDIRITGLDLGSSVNINVIMKNDENFIKSADITIAGEEYAAWGDDDSYLENLVLYKLGLNKRNEPIFEPVPIMTPPTEPIPEQSSEPVHQQYIGDAGEGLPL